MTQKPLSYQPCTETLPCTLQEQGFIPYEHQFVSCEQQIARRHYYQKVADSCIDIAKVACIEEVRTRAWLQRQTLKEEAAERRKSQFDELILSKNGDFHVVTKNTNVHAIPRKICNATNFESYLIKKMQDPEEELLLIACNVNGETKEILLNPEKLEKQGYLSRKFASAGVVFYPSGQKKKDILWQLLTQCYNNISSTLYLPSETGWVRKGNDTFDFIYVKEEELTWKTAVKKAN